MRPKTLVLAAAIAVLIALLAQGAVSRLSVHEDDDGDRGEPLRHGQGAEAALAASRGASDRPRSRAQRSAANVRAWESLAGQAGAGAAPPAAAQPEETRGAYDDEETIWGDNLPEDRSVYASEPTEQFWQWRRTLADEAPDPTWAEQLGDELTRQARGRLRGMAAFHQIDCRETMCQLYLQTDDALDAAALFAAMRNAGIEVESQQLAASVQLEGAAYGGTTHELVVRRQRPERMPPHVAGAARAYRLALAAEEAPE